MNESSKQILDKWATTIIRQKAIYKIPNGEAGINRELDEHYKSTNYSEDICLWIPPKDCIRLEFEDTPDQNLRYIMELESTAKSLNLDYCITYHKGGKSPYFNLFNIKNIPFNKDNRNAKILFIDTILPAGAEKSLDKTNLGWTYSPVIGHPHWKPKYNGAIHEIVSGKNPLEHNNEYPKALLQQLKKAKKENKKNTINILQNNKWLEDFFINYCSQNKISAGGRHDVIEKNMTALLIFRSDWPQIKESYLKSQERQSDSIRTWENAILQGKYTQVSIGEIINYIKEKNINYTIPQSQQITEAFKELKINNYLQNIEDFRKYQPFFYDKNQLFWFWNKQQYKWEIVDDIDIMNALEKQFMLTGQTINSKIKTEYLETFKRIGRQHTPKKAPKRWIQFQNKAYSLRSGKTYDITPEYFFTNPLPYQIGTTNETPTIDKLFTEWVGETNKQTLYELTAYCCYTGYPIHLIFCIVGTGRNGKSKFQKLLTKFLGKDNTCSTELDTLLTSRFESFKLYKKLLCTMGETNFGILNKTSLLKKLTGEDMIGFELKNKGLFDDINYSKIVIASNSLPVSEDTSEGFYRRWLIIDFPNAFPEGKNVLDQIPEEEYNNLSRKVTEILPQLLEKATFTHQGTVEERQDKYIMSSNPLPLFIEHCCIKGENEFVSYNELYNAYIQGLKSNKKRRVNRKEFKQALEEEGFYPEKTSKNEGLDAEGYPKYKILLWIDGLGLKTDWRKNLRFCEKNSFLNLIASRIVPAIGNVSKISKIAKDGESEKATGVDLCDICRENTCFLDKMVCEKCWFLMPDTPFNAGF